MRLLLPVLGLTLATLTPQGPTATEVKARHMLNRLAFGPRPQDVEKLAAGGDASLKAWIQDQMKPGPDPRIEKQLTVFPTLAMRIPELQKAYPRPEVLAKKEGLDPKSSEADRDKLRDLIPFEQRPARIEEELQSAKLIRATLSDRQLEERLVDFWFNHFNVDLGKGEARWFTASYERDAIRPNVFGRFRDLLGATAHHPAMLWYLDNWLSVKDGFDPAAMRRELQAERDLRHPRRGPRATEIAPLERQSLAEAEAKMPKGLNENYARELLELHTLGVDGGYTQADVREVARCFTGWSIDQPRMAAAFRFHPLAHDAGAKVVLGRKVTAGGMQDGETVLDLLARHPSTARFIATKLCRYFVADVPPEALVKRIADVFLKHDGELRPVYAALFESPEFWAATDAKVKSPFEMMASSLRAVDAAIDDPVPLVRQVARMGQPLYRCAPPTGYKDAAETWVSSGALVNRLQWGLALGRQQVKAASWDGEALWKATQGRDAEDTVDRLARRLLGKPLGAASREAVLKELGDDHGASDSEPRPIDRAKLVGLLLGAPEFQRR